MTFLVGLLVILMALGVGIIVGRRRGLILGIAMAFGILVVGGIVYIGLLSFALPM